jgi:RNA polymerase sigma-70 factor (ECF subfamily)
VSTRDVTMAEAERLALEALARDASATLQMDEEAFRSFYDRTSRSLWAYLVRLTGDRHAADDLLQDAYYRFLRAGSSHATDEHRRHALFHIATNLARDLHRRRKVRGLLGGFTADSAVLADARDQAGATETRADLTRAMARLKPRERALIWLAYAHGSTHEEIASTLGVRAGSVKSLLWRARRKLSALLGPIGARS